MLAVSAVLPDTMPDHPPLILIHGSAKFAAVWGVLQPAPPEAGWVSYANDLRGHGQSGPRDLSHTSMQDYAADLTVLVTQCRQPPVLIGWSMGGLVALMVAATGAASAWVGLAPSTPARQLSTSVALRTGEFGGEEYGITSRDPDEQPAMADLDREERLMDLTSLGRESRLARDERQRGIVIEALPCPLLIVTGTKDRAWPRERYNNLWLTADYLSVEGASHWGLVLQRRALSSMIPEVLHWITQHT